MLSRAFVKKAAKVFSGYGLGQLIYFIATPLLTRTYAPHAFGYFALFISVVTIALPILTLQYHNAIPLPKSHRIAFSILLLVLGILLGMSMLVGAFVLLFSHYVSAYLGLSSQQVWILIVGMCVQALFQILTVWSIRFSKFGYVALGKVVQNLTIVLAQVSVFYFFSAHIGLIIGYVVGSAVGCFYLLFSLRDSLLSYRHFSFRSLVYCSRRYVKFPKYNSWSNFADNIALWFPVIFINAFFSVSAAGIFSTVMRIVQAPSGLISQALSQVLLGEAAELERASQDFAPLLLHVTRVLLVFALAYFLVVFFAAYLLPFVLGPGWHSAEVYTQLLAPSICAMFVASPLSVVINIKRRNELSALWQVSALVVTVLALFVSLIWHDLIVSLLVLSLVNVLLYAWYLALVYLASSVSLGRIFVGAARSS